MAATYYALDKFLGVEKNKDWSKDYLENANIRMENDTRISDRINARKKDTKPTIAQKEVIGNYNSDMYGEIRISEQEGKLTIDFAHSPLLSASLTHWHYDVWKINWDHPHAWFSFGTIKFNANNNQEVIGFDFDVPNDDFFFEELKPYKVKRGK
jgi:hypothetical protein